jgi:hypothetical protein
MIKEGALKYVGKLEGWLHGKIESKLRMCQLSKSAKDLLDCLGNLKVRNLP